MDSSVPFFKTCLKAVIASRVLDISATPYLCVLIVNVVHASVLALAFNMSFATRRSSDCICSASIFQD